MNLKHRTDLVNEISPAKRHLSSQEYLRRFIAVTVLLIPMIFFTKQFNNFLGIPEYASRRYLQFTFATVIAYSSLVFFKHARHEIRARQYGMMTLVSIAILAGYTFSAASTFLPQLQDVEFYLEISTLIWVLLFGHYLEAKSTTAAGDALREVEKLLPRIAHFFVNKEIKEIDVSELKKGYLILVKPGERFPADGIIIEGSANVDESLISGESKPVEKKKGDRVVAGSICIDSALKVQLERVGKFSTVGQIKKLIIEAKLTKPSAQKIADQASRILTIIAVFVALITLAAWSLIIREPFVFALTLSITVLVIACPHALGLAIPTVTSIATTLAIRNGLFIKDMAKLEAVKDLNYIIFDKTGTLTEGSFTITDIVHGNEIKQAKTDKLTSGQQDIFKIAAELEQNASHVIALAIVEKAKKMATSLRNVTDFRNYAGKGVSGKIDGNQYFIGNKKFIEEMKIETSDLKTAFDKLSNEGKTTLFVADKKKALGIIALSDKIKKESFRTIKSLHKLDLKIIMLSGDNELVTRNAAKKLKIDTYFANVLPKEKYKYVIKLQKGGKKVMMVGDGINDAPAITQSDVGVAIGAGTEISVEAGDIVLTRNNPEDVVRLIILGKRVYRKMVENLIWAFGYNVAAIPIAAGIFSSYGILLRPELGAVFMSLSTVIVIINAMGLRRVRLNLPFAK